MNGYSKQRSIKRTAKNRGKNEKSRAVKGITREMLYAVVSVWWLTHANKHKYRRQLTCLCTVCECADEGIKHWTAWYGLASQEPSTHATHTHTHTHWTKPKCQYKGATRNSNNKYHSDRINQQQHLKYQHIWGNVFSTHPLARFSQLYWMKVSPDGLLSASHSSTHTRMRPQQHSLFDATAHHREKKPVWLCAQASISWKPIHTHEWVLLVWLLLGCQRMKSGRQENARYEQQQQQQQQPRWANVCIVCVTRMSTQQEPCWKWANTRSLAGCDTGPHSKQHAQHKRKRHVSARVHACMRSCRITNMLDFVCACAPVYGCVFVLTKYMHALFIEQRPRKRESRYNLDFNTLTECQCLPERLVFNKQLNGAVALCYQSTRNSWTIRICELELSICVCRAQSNEFV